MNIKSVQIHDRLGNKYVNNFTKEQYQTPVQNEVSQQQPDTFERSEVSAPKNKSNDTIKKTLIIAAVITAAVAIICAIKGKSRQAKDLANKASSTTSAAKTGTQAAGEAAQKQARKAATTGIKLKTQEEFDKMSLEELDNYRADLLRGFDKLENADRGPLRRELAKIQLKKMEVQRIETFESLKGKIPDKTTVKLHTKTGEEVEAAITLEKGLHGADYRRSAKVNSQVEGRADIMVHKKGEDSFFAGIPEEYYKEGAFEVHLLGTSPDYKGCGTKLMQQVVRDSQNAGCGGRVFLDACNSDLPSDYCYLSRGKNGSPVPFYYKLGFRFQDPMRNEYAEKGIEKMAKTGKYCGISDGIMYLPEENIAALLAK